MTKRVCAQPGCPELVDSGRCDTHTRERDKARGTSTQRGYGSAHQAERRRWAIRIEHGTTRCARCGGVIQPDTTWDLDHTDDRAGYLGPSHAACNRATARHQG